MIAPDASRGRLGVIRHTESDFEIYRYFHGIVRGQPSLWRTKVSKINLEESEWLASRMPQMNLGEVIELLPEPPTPSL
jgi:hypothetical protein